MLMLCHCVPVEHAEADRDGRARALQLLRQFGRSFEISAACVYDRPIHLDQWRALDQRTAQLAISTKRTRRRLFAAALRKCARRHHHVVAADRVQYHGALTKTIKAWTAGCHFAAVLTTHPILLREAAKIAAPPDPVASRPVTFCDLAAFSAHGDPLSIEHTFAPPAAPTSQLDYLLVDNLEAYEAAAAYNRRVILIPQSDDAHQITDFDTRDVHPDMTIPQTLARAA